MIALLSIVVLVGGLMWPPARTVLTDDTSGRVSVSRGVASRSADGSVRFHTSDQNGWHVINLGGVISSAPSTAQSGAETVVVGSNGGIVFANRSNAAGVWAGWIPVAQGSDPVVVAFGAELHIIYKGPSGNVMDTWFAPSGTRTQNLNGVASGILAAQVDSLGLHIMVANGGIVFHKWFFQANFAWYDWAPVSTGSDPTTVSIGGTLHVVSRASNGNVIHAWSAYAGWQSENLGGVIVGAPALTFAAGAYRVLGANVGWVFERRSGGGGWSDWVPLTPGRDPVSPYAVELVDKPIYAVYSRVGVDSVLYTSFVFGTWSSVVLP